MRFRISRSATERVERSKVPLEFMSARTCRVRSAGPLLASTHSSMRSLVGLSSLVSLSTSARSEEHTSELQSRQYLVCRLLLEKKKTEETTASTCPTYDNDA